MHYDDGKIQLFQPPEAPRPLWRALLDYGRPVLVMLAAWALIALALLFFTGCQFAQREQPINDKASGAPLYVHEVTGKATAEPTDAQGNPRERATVPVSANTVEQGVDIARGISGALPPPAGLVVELIGASGLAAFYAALRHQRRKRLEEYGLNEELIELAADDADVARKVEEQGSSEAKRRLADKRARKRRSKAPAPA